MKQIFGSLVAVLLLCGFSCAQTGPTVHKVVGNFTQSTTAGLTGNCWYRGTASGTYVFPGNCGAPSTTFTDAAVTSGATYYYAVTAQITASGVTEESGYSNEISATIPVSPAAPKSLSNSQTAELRQPKSEDELADLTRRTNALPDLAGIWDELPEQPRSSPVLTATAF